MATRPVSGASGAGGAAAALRPNLGPSVWVPLRYLATAQAAFLLAVTWALFNAEGLADHYYRADPAVKTLEKENERLRKIIAKQALELEVKEELLKKMKLL